MKLLLDTHTFIWWDSEPARLSPQALALCQDRQNVLLLSVVSVWEMQIKLQLGKLRLALPLKRDHRNPATDQQHRDIACYAGTRAGIGKFASLSQGPF
jgi:PIN domain nuclease of toxin-antitoxin system